MFRILSTLLLSAVALFHFAAAHAQSCGDTITHDVTLTADLHCTTGWFALYVPTHGVTVDLDGHTISGSRDLSGSASTTRFRCASSTAASAASGAASWGCARTS